MLVRTAQAAQSRNGTGFATVDLLTAAVCLLGVLLSAARLAGFVSAVLAIRHCVLLPPSAPVSGTPW